MTGRMEDGPNGDMGGMDKGGVGLVEPPEDGLQEPEDSRRPLGPSGAQHGAGVANPAEPEPGAGSGPQSRTDDVAGIRTSGRPSVESVVPPGAPGQVDRLGRVKTDVEHALCAETPSGLDVRRLRPTDAVRLLNSTPMGRVISDRQLRRHQTRSEGMFCRGRRIDLFAYAAWLASHLSQERDSATGNVSTGNVLAQIERQQFTCALTGRRLEPETASLDHVIPLTQGGGHVIENTQVLHRDVNRAKGLLTNEQFIALCREVVAWADSRQAGNH